MGSDDPRLWMWSEALGALARAERLQREMFKLTSTLRSRPSWEPPVDMLETEDRVVIVAALPGVEEKAVMLEIDGACLVIRGERTLPEDLRRAVVHRLELPQGYFERRVPLPAGRYESARHYAKDGCIVVTLRKLA